MLHLDQSAKGRWIKLGSEWVKLSRISSVGPKVGGKIKVKFKDKKGQDKELDYGGQHVDRVKAILDKEAGTP